MVAQLWLGLVVSCVYCLDWARADNVGEYDLDYIDGVGAYQSIDLDSLSLGDLDYGYEFDDLDFAGVQDDADPLNYYGDDIERFYDKYGFYEDEMNDYFLDSEEGEDDCKMVDGKAKLKEPVCDVIIAGGDKLADKLPGGLDGTYKVNGCWEGRPTYAREIKRKGEERILWYSHLFSDWDINVGDAVNESSSAIVAFGSSLSNSLRPNFVPEENWSLRASWSSAVNGSDLVQDFLRVNLTLACADGAVLKGSKAPAAASHNLLTDEESDATYRAIYAASSKPPEPTLNVAMLALMVCAGAGVVLGVPYVMNKRKEKNGKTFGQMLEDARKQRVGHVS